MRIVTAEEMRKLDRYAIEKIGVSAAVLMESAGRSVIGWIRQRHPRLQGLKVGVLSGPGNNGGDGFVVARYLHLLGVEVETFLIGARRPKRGEALRNLEILERLGLRVVPVKQRKSLRSSSLRWDFAVDAIFGTGLERPLAGIFAEAVLFLNELRCPVYAVDIPTGLHSDTGEVLGAAVKATATITFACKKRAFVLGKGPSYAGEVKVADISIDERWADQVGASRLFEIDGEWVSSLFPARRWDTHKGTLGHVVILAGSLERSGAAVLAANAALRAGAGLVTVAVPRSAHAVIKTQLTEVMSYPLDDDDGRLDTACLEEVIELCKEKSALVIGPGLKNHAGLRSLLTALLERIEFPIVLDADGLNAFGVALLKKRLNNVIVTPHPGEMARLTARTVKEIQGDRIHSAREFSDHSGAVVVLKGAHTVVALPEGDTFLNPTGNPAMATAGMGDVLSGMAGAYVAQGLNLGEAALAAVYHHGLAGDRVAAREGKRGLLAHDVIEELPHLSK